MDQWVAATLSRRYYQMQFQLHIISCYIVLSKCLWYSVIVVSKKTQH